MKIIVNEYPWPPKELSPNARVHWSTKSKAIAKYREDCYFLTKFDLSLKRGVNYGMTIYFHPGNRIRRDLDNFTAASKALIDGMCSRLGIDDSDLHPLTIDWGDDCKKSGGKVVVEIYESKIRNPFKTLLLIDQILQEEFTAESEATDLYKALREINKLVNQGE